MESSGAILLIAKTVNFTGTIVSNGSGGVSGSGSSGNGGGAILLIARSINFTGAISSSGGALTSQQRYLPFGQVRTDLNGPRVTQTDFAYTGQRALDGLGLMDYKARAYDPEVGCFTQPDSIVPNAANPQSFNRYAYTLGNPIRYIDPTGHISCQALPDGCLPDSPQPQNPCNIDPDLPQCRMLGHSGGRGSTIGQSSGGNTAIQLGYSGPLPHNLVSQLEKNGANPALLTNGASC